MKTRNIFIISAIIATAISLIQGCSKSAPSPDKSRRGELTVGVAYALGGKGDLSYNDAVASGVTELRASGVNVKEFEPSSLDESIKALKALAAGRPRLIFCVGFLYDDPVKNVSPQFTDITFVVLDGAPNTQTNVITISFDTKQGSEMAGAVAASLSQSGKVAFIGGTDIPIIREFESGFEIGAKAINTNISVLPLYVGSGIPAFTDPVKGREVALSAISEGADVIYHAAGASGNGVIKAAREKNIKCIGVDVDQTHLAPDQVVTSMTKNFDVSMLRCVDLMKSNQLSGGASIIMNVKNGGISLTPINPKFDSKDVEEAIAKVRAQF